MFEKEYNSIAETAAKKISFLKRNKIGYFTSSMLAGIYIGIGILLIFSIGGQLGTHPMTKFFMGISFGIALSLVVIAGADLFTGNNLIMSVGIIKKTVSLNDSIILWLICFLGNWFGSIILAILFHFSGLDTMEFAEFVNKTAVIKTTLSPLALFTRAILCNLLVCLAVWCSYKCTSESGKLIMIFWCLFAFITTGFEHSVANMTLLSCALINNINGDLSILGYLYNIITVALGNITGAIILLALPYAIISKEKEV
ncbi:nitrite transporter NirC [Peptacetobacter hominis]|uniref:Nitrite transporter NirC n=1 Tax=Peptacetobacter hominis TaxID=2743610 RepID=A0A544QT47_9FIRM|nr:formate/nitrite transporter family protein [Peptacetobacter hominis]TQQ83216.1 nitrite transporter NirC [Peptacetobacter hominis]